MSLLTVVVVILALLISGCNPTSSDTKSEDTYQQALDSGLRITESASKENNMPIPIKVLYSVHKMTQHGEMCVFCTPRQSHALEYLRTNQGKDRLRLKKVEVNNASGR